MKHLLLLHGALGSAKQLEPLKEILSGNYRVSTFNFPGHGGENIPSLFSIDDFADNLISFLKNKGNDVTHIFGHSMGGYVALKASLVNPGRIGKIITLGTRFDWSEEFAKKQTAMLVPDAIEEKAPAFVSYLQQLHPEQDWKVIMKRTAEMMTAMATGNKLTPEDLGGIPNDVLITVGDQDRMVSVEESQAAANALRNGRFLFIPGFTHPVQEIDAMKMAGVISGFIG